MANGLIAQHVTPICVKDLKRFLAWLAHNLVSERLTVAVLIHVALTACVQTQRRRIANAHHIGKGVVHMRMRTRLHHTARPDSHLMTITIGRFDADGLAPAIPIELGAQRFNHVYVVTIVSRGQNNTASCFEFDIGTVLDLSIHARDRTILGLRQTYRPRRKLVVRALIDRFLVLLGNRSHPVFKLYACAVLFTEFVGIVITLGIGPKLQEILVGLIKDLCKPVKGCATFIRPFMPQALVWAIAHSTADLIDHLIVVIGGPERSLIRRIQCTKHQATNGGLRRLFHYDDACSRLGCSSRRGDASDACADNHDVSRFDNRAIRIHYCRSFTEPVTAIKRLLWHWIRNPLYGRCGLLGPSRYCKFSSTGNRGHSPHCRK